MHGGNAGRPIVHGRYSVRMKGRLGEIVSEYLDDPEAGENLQYATARLNGVIDYCLEQIDAGINAAEMKDVTRALTQLAGIIQKRQDQELKGALARSEWVRALEWFAEDVDYVLRQSKRSGEPRYAREDVVTEAKRKWRARFGR